MISSVFDRLFVVTLLCTSSVLGFGMLNSLRLIQLQALEHSKRSTASPADALVDLLLDTLDSDHDDQIAMTEVEGYVDNVFNPTGDPNFVLPSYRVHEKGYIMTVAALMDTNDNGVIATDELQRASRLLVTLVGDEQLGRAAEIIIRSQTQANPDYLSSQVNKVAPDFMNLSDVNKDGEITIEELHSAIPLRYSSWIEDSIDRIIEDVDTNDDSVLSAEETVQFISNLATRERWLFRKLVIFFRVMELAGKDLANQWAETA